MQRRASVEPHFNPNIEFLCDIRVDVVVRYERNALMHTQHTKEIEMKEENNSPSRLPHPVLLISV